MVGMLISIMVAMVVGINLIPVISNEVKKATEGAPVSSGPVTSAPVPLFTVSSPMGSLLWAFILTIACLAGVWVFSVGRKWYEA